MRYKGKLFTRVDSIYMATNPTEDKYGFVAVERLFLSDKVYSVTRDEYAQLAIPLLFERFQGWLNAFSHPTRDSVNPHDGLTVQLAFEIERAGLLPKIPYSKPDLTRGTPGLRR